jgi:hypothetical protein
MYTEIYVKALEARAEKQKRALMVFVLCPNIRQWLVENDPKALQQAREALGFDELIKRLDAPSRSEADDFAALFTDNP